LILVTLYVCYFSHLGVIGFVGPDEPRYAWIARDMAETGDWVTPRLYGKPWFEKPPLLYWGSALFFKLFGSSAPEVAARLPSAISALLATLALAWLARRTYGEECARWLLLLLPTSVGMIGFSHAAATDMPFAGMLTIAMVCAAVALGLAVKTENTPILPRTPWLALLLFGFFLGLAVLAKGPAAIILSGGAIFFWAVFTKRWRDAFRLLHPAAIASFSLTAMPWYILCAHRNSDFFRVFIIEHNFKRYLTPEFQHVQPFWFYIPILLIAFLPWITLGLWAGYSATIEFPTNKTGQLSALLLSYSLFCLLFFSASKSKLPGYILPAIPTIGLLLARIVQTNKLRYRKSFIGSGLVGALLFFLAAVFAALVLSGRITVHSNEMAIVVLGFVSFCFTLANLFLIFVRWQRTRPSQIPLPPLAAPPVLVAVILSHFLLMIFFPYDPSGRTLTYEIRPEIAARPDLFVGKMNRGKHYSLNFYLKKEIPDWDQKSPRTGLLLMESKNCSAIVPAPYTCSSEPLEFYASGIFGYQISRSDSLERLGDRGKPKQKE
jgi:4-amino-4-deoxy-L-arabinose transferase-like glycosyltransferase